MRMKASKKLIADMPISSRLKNALHRDGIDTLQDLADTPVGELVRIPNLGVKLYGELFKELSKESNYRKLHP